MFDVTLCHTSVLIFKTMSFHVNIFSISHIIIMWYTFILSMPLEYLFISRFKVSEVYLESDLKWLIIISLIEQNINYSSTFILEAYCYIVQSTAGTVWTCYGIWDFAMKNTIFKTQFRNIHWRCTILDISQDPMNMQIVELWFGATTAYIYTSGYINNTRLFI